jgi:eukaryotic-like serine/threonine-protein kinase
MSMSGSKPPPAWGVPGYVVEDLLGRGASGDVWRARVARTGEPVALKRLALTDPTQADVARAEAAVLSALNHPHLIRVHELVRTSDAVVLVLDLADAGSLADLLRRRMKLTPGEVVTALAPIGAALAYLHGEGVVHGDVSAANVLFTSIGLPLLADLGVARIVGDEAPARGTPAYLDPIVANGYLPGAASDVFCLAAVAVHALSGRSVWSGATADEMTEQAAAAMFADPIDIDSRLPAVPEPMRAVLGRALLADPAKRATAAEFALDLRHSLAPSPVELRAGRAPAPGPVPAPSDGQFTYGVRLPDIDPANLPRPRRLRIPDAARVRLARVRVRRNRVGVGLAVAGAVAIAIAAFVMVRAPGSDQPSGRAPSGATLAAATGSLTPSGSGSSAPSITDTGTAATVLADLDEVRERAFAERAPQLLAQVYVSAELLAEDTATLNAVVQVGCTLTGVRTAYSNIRLVPGETGAIAVVATATLAPSTLVCGGSPAGNLAGASATTLRIELARSPGAQYRIASQQVL